MVVVMADGRVAGTAERTISRPDVAAAHTGAGDRSGWSAVVDLGRVGPQVALSVHALVAAGAGSGQAPRIVLLPFAERTLGVTGGGQVRGELSLPDHVSPGTLRVEGTADITPALARVEVRLDDGDPVRARHSLPSEPDLATGDEGRLRGFSVTLEIPPDVTSVTPHVTVVATDGTRCELPTTAVPVVPGLESTESADRRRVQAARLGRYLDSLRATHPPGRRILVAAHDLGIGGAQGYLDDLMDGLHARDLEFCVVAGGTGPLLERIESVYGAPVLVVGQVPDTPELLETRIRLVAGFALEHGAGACLANTIATFWAVLAAKRLGIPSLWAVHESFAPAVFWHEYLGRPAHPGLVSATSEALARCDEVVFEAESTRELYTSSVSPGAATLLPYGIDIDAADRVFASTDREQARTSLDIAHDRRVLLCVGSVEPRKGQIALARAFGRMHEAARSGTSLYLVGASDTAYSRALRDFVHDAGLQQVHVVDADPDILRWYAAADVLVSASDVESMPRTMLEAMLAGRPVAATASFGVGELVEDGVSGWLCEPGDLSALTGLLTRAATADQEVVDSLGLVARSRVLSDHGATGYVHHVGQRMVEWLERPSEALA